MVNPDTDSSKFLESFLLPTNFPETLATGDGCKQAQGMYGWKPLWSGATLTPSEQQSFPPSELRTNPKGSKGQRQQTSPLHPINAHRLANPCLGKTPSVGKGLVAGVGRCRSQPRGELGGSPMPRTTCLQASGEEPGSRQGRNVPARPAHGSLFTACLPLLPSQHAGGFFFGKRGSARAFTQLPAPVTLIVASIQRDKNLIGELGKARCQQVTPPRSGLKSAFKGNPCSECAVSRPETMCRSRGESQLAHVFLFSSY